jgi:hypothetical protein
MFICPDCAKEIDDIPSYMFLFMTSYGPCELCHHNASCIDWHGSINKKVKHEKA